MKTIICLGPCCSGKTTWSLDLVRTDPSFIRFSLDEFRLMTLGSLKNDNVNVKYLTILFNFAKTLNELSKNLVVDNIPLEPQWIHMLCITALEVEIRLFDVDFKESLIRSKIRKQSGGHCVKPAEMMRYREVYKEFLKHPAFINAKNKPKVSIICDDFVGINKQFIV